MNQQPGFSHVNRLESMHLAQNSRVPPRISSTRTQICLVSFCLCDWGYGFRYISTRRTQYFQLSANYPEFRHIETPTHRQLRLCTRRELRLSRCARACERTSPSDRAVGRLERTLRAAYLRNVDMAAYVSCV